MGQDYFNPAGRETTRSRSWRANCRAFTAWLSTLRRTLASEVAALRERIEKIRCENDLLRARLGRIDPRVRPLYKSWERMGILFHRTRLGLSADATAKVLLVTPTTAINLRVGRYPGMVLAVSLKYTKRTIIVSA